MRRFLLIASLLVTSLAVHPHALAAGQRTKETSRTARALDHIQRAKEGGLVPAASALNKRPRVRLHELSAEQLLDRAAESAPTRPSFARVFLERARAKSAKSGVPLSEETVKRIQGAVDHFTAHPAPRLDPAEPGLRAQIPSAKGIDPARLRRYARLYAKMPREYNGARPGETLKTHPELSEKTAGRVPYWDVDPAQVDVELLGLADRTPFRLPDGKVRIFSHYLSEKEHAAIETAVGAPPSGSIPSEMTSAYRTLVMYPEDGTAPYMLKFSGHEVPPWGEKKRLSRTDVAMSVERSLQLRNVKRLVPEPAGLHMPGVDANVLYRPIPLPRGGLRRGDRMITWQVLMSKEFRATPAGQRIFRNHGSVESWFRTQAIPRLVDVLEESLFDSFAHYEVHSQNLDVLVGADGTVREIFVKDLLDMLHDPGMEAVISKKTPRATGALRDREWGNLNEERSDSKFSSPRSFYDTFLSQTGMDGGTGPHSRLADKATQKEFGRQLRARIRTRLGPDADRVESRLQRRMGDDAHVGEVVEGYRYAIMATKIEAAFQPRPSAQAHFKDTPGRVSGSEAGGPYSQALGYLKNVEYGTVHGTPVAIERGRGGQVERFWFKFD